MAGRISGVVVQVVLRGIRKAIGRNVPGDEALLEAARGELGVPLDGYRRLLRTVRFTEGGRVLLQAGRVLEAWADPLLFVLLNSENVRVLIEKEGRLARFIHSRHVVRLVAEGSDWVRCEHSSQAAEPAWPEENLASAGQHICLLEQLGYQGLRLRFPESESPTTWVYERGTYRAVPEGIGLCVWEFRWDSFQPTRRPMPGLDQVLLAREERPELSEKPEIVIQVEGVLGSDLGRTWGIAEVAQKLSSSTRSLQRRLKEHETSFSKVVDETRLEEAMRLLRHSEFTITEIAYVCGFSDPSHMARRFGAHFGRSPSEARAST